MQREMTRFERDALKFDRTSIQVFDSFQEADESDRQYWRSLTPFERMQALEYIRKMAWGYDEKSQLELCRSPELLQLARRDLHGDRRIRG